jgi:hypothetical protein
LNLERSFERRNLVGGTSREQVSRAVEIATQDLHTQAIELEAAGQQIEGTQ